MSGKRYRTNFVLWATCSAIIYALLVAFGSISVKGSVAPVWLIWREIFVHFDEPEMEFWLLIVVVPFGIFSLCIGWFVHAFALVGMGWLSVKKPGRDRPIEPSAG